HFEYTTFRQRYIGYLTFALNYRLHGLNVAGYHLVNLFIHISTALLLYLIVTLTFQTPLLRASPVRDYAPHIAVFTALLFACHPLQTQAVTYIWQRVTSLAAMLYLLSLTAYVRWRLSASLRTAGAKALPWYVLALLSAVLAMKTKETAFMLPLTLAMYEFLFFQGKTLPRIGYLLPLLLTMLIVPLTLFSIDRPAGELIDDVSDVTRGHSNLSRYEYLMTSLRVIVTYIRLLFLPVNQNLDHDYPTYRSLLDMPVTVSAVFLLCIAGLGVLLLLRSRNGAPHLRIISFGIFWFFLNLALESSVIPLNNVIFEHRLYLPSMGVFLAVTVLVFHAVQKLKERWKGAGRAAVLILAGVVLALTGATYARNGKWGDEVTLWQDVVSKSPVKAWARISL
ncbi:MAG: tetratricopeptide repeat protein, partial [Anaerolineae bacterium]|nr:tetratricopeptide repeat protein [Anaerolineae bacterium]